MKSCALIELFLFAVFFLIVIYVNHTQYVHSAPAVQLKSLFKKKIKTIF